jgi:DNA-directed RNA polymerase II subunit RPB1
MLSIRKNRNPARIIGVQFSMLSPEEIRKNSVVEVLTRDTFINNKPVVGGLFDPRMGTIDPEIICPTDGYNYIHTPGYFGHIELARPVFYMQHFKEIVKICKCVCFKCSKLLLDKDQHKHILTWNNEDRWDYVYKTATKAKSKRCSFLNQDGCGCKQFDRIKLDNMSHLYAIWENMKIENSTEKENVTVRMTPEIVLKIFKRISDDDIQFMGFSPVFSRPEWLICEALAVPPPAVRPSVKHDANQRSEDDLTQIYATIIKTNNDLKEKIRVNAPAQLIDSVASYLQYYIANIANNKIKGSAGPMQQRSGRPLQCIRDRLDGKTGRIRGNLMGKRVDYSARSVITADPNLSIRELGVPMKIAKNLTKPVVVNEKNRDYLLKLVQNGPDVYPGAKTLERKNGDNISLRNVDRLSVQLEDGDVVHRHLVDGDAVLFNRQPSLHRMSMMCHIVRVMKQGDTFRMNVACTKPYNADFDGDEMNMHAPQNITAEAELRNLAAIPFQIISPSSNAPIIGIFQDSLLGSYRLTRDNIVFTPRDAMNLLMMFPRIDPTRLFDSMGRKGTVTNFDVISQIVPPLTLKYKTKLFDEEPNQDAKTSNHVLEIRNGQYVRGQIEKGVLGSGTKGILHRICNDFGNAACSDFIDDLQNIVTEYMKSSSFSVGISDLIADNATQDKIIDTITKQKREVQTLIDRVHLGIFENTTANTNAIEFERQVNAILNKAAEHAGKIGRDNLSEDNRFVTIVKCGSKGSTLNISQMISCLGQQNVDGKRIPYGFDNRTLPHFTKYDDSPSARGFIENSYINGLTPPQLFFHAMGGRIGLIDTACKTSQTGYIQRKLIKGLEDLKVEYDGTVRNSLGKIIQFIYGDDGAETVRIESQNISLGNMSIEDIYAHYDLGLDDKTTSKLVFTKGTATRIMGAELADTKKKCMDYIEKMIEWRDELMKHVFNYKNENSVKSPVAFNYIIANIQGQMSLGANTLVDITPLTAFQLIEQNFAKLEKIRYAKPSHLFEILYYYYLNPKDLLVVKRFNRQALIILLEQVNLMYKRSIVNPGEMVGVIAGQSIGEPTTQMTLNSVTYETEIIVRDSKLCIHKVRIGDFVKEHMHKSSKVTYYNEKDTTYAELFEGEEYYEIPGANEEGETVWNRIEAVTQHPVINKDGTNTMLKITTTGQKDVTVTKAKSVLKLMNGKIKQADGETLKIGDYLVVSRRPLEYNPCDVLRLNEILPVEIDTELDLDYDFGYLVGAYAAEGCMTKHQISISNNELAYFEPILRVCKKFDVTTKIYIHENKNQKGRKSTDIRIYNTLLCDLLENLCGKLSHNKFISPKIVFSNNECIRGFLDAYIGGDGCVNKRLNEISITSVSLQLLLDVQVMTRNLHIVGKIRKHKKLLYNNRGTLPENIHQPYVIYFRQNQSKYLANILSLYIPSKQERIMKLRAKRFKYEISKNDDMVFPNEIEGVIQLETRDSRMKDLLFEKIIHIEEVPNTTNYAYDLTVENTRNFDTYTGINLEDTFHYSGVASKSNVTRGVPRIEEILRLTKNPKHPSLTVFLKPQDELDKDKAMQYTHMLEHTKLVDIIKTVQICFDPDARNTTIDQDKLWLAQYHAFEDIVNSCAGQELTEAPQTSKWIIRAEMDAETMLDKNITMDDVHYALTNFSPDLTCAFSDYNADNLIFRIRLNSSVFSKKKAKNVLYTLDQTDELYMLNNFQENLLNNVVLRGISGIKNVMPRKLQGYTILEDGKYVAKDKWILDTTGTNLMQVLGLDYIDSVRTYSNDIKEVQDVLGIEATRQIIYNEFQEVIEFSGSYVNSHHVQLLADRMTLTKNLVPIFRSGILNDNIGPIAKATFEVHTEEFLNAARHGLFDHMRGISANVMTGQNGCFGTSSFQLVLDMEKMMTMDEYVPKKDDTMDSLMADFARISVADNCSKETLTIANNIESIKHIDLGEAVCRGNGNDEDDVGF